MCGRLLVWEEPMEMTSLWPCEANFGVDRARMILPLECAVRVVPVLVGELENWSSYHTLCKNLNLALIQENYPIVFYMSCLCSNLFRSCFVVPFL